jgi:hypothetical protein
LPLLMGLDAAGGDLTTLVGLEQLVLPQSDRLLHVEAQNRGIPPDHLVPGFGDMLTRNNRGGLPSLGWPLDD